MGNIFRIFLSMIIILSTTVDFNAMKSKDLYKEIMKEDYIFMEQGVQGKYLSENNIEEELSNIKDILGIKGEFEKNNNGFSFNLEENDTKLNIFALKGKRGINVEVSIISNNGKYKVEEVTKNIKELNKSVKVSTYVKGKINNFNSVEDNAKALEEKLSKFGTSRLESIPITSGVTGIAKLNEGEQLNYAVLSYDRNEQYVIVGTPVIFITY